ncbi:MAG: hypothetical protein NTX61_01785 [Bacteroidetes bacterium]|nr:hypothetical protein [Bacteroidota bacterium]
MERTQVQLKEVVVHAKEDFIYDLIYSCRKKLFQYNTRRVAKVYYGIETQTRDQPVELLECYYNGIIDGSCLTELKFRNGRIGLASLDNRYFLTRNTSKAMIMISLTGEGEHSPLIPLQLSKRLMKKKFTVSLEYTDDKMNNYYLSILEINIWLLIKKTNSKGQID